MKEIVALDQSVLIISDLHFPFAHQDWFEFLKAIKDTYKPDLIVNVGDSVDGHGISFHDSDSAVQNPDKELEDAIDEISLLNALYPKMYICESNHGSLIYRRLKHHGIPVRHLVPLHELYNTPQWSWHDEIMLDTHIGKTLVVHGKTGAYNKLSMESGCNAAQGHHHSKAEITWQRSSIQTRFNMIVGCLVDENSLAMAYGKNFVKRPILSVGWLNELGEPSLIRMVLDKNNRWIGRL